MGKEKKNTMIKAAERIKNTAVYVEGEIPEILEGKLKVGRTLKNVLLELKKAVHALKQEIDQKVKELREESGKGRKKKKSKKGKKGKKPPKISAEELGDMDVDELEDVVNTYELDVDLDDYKTAKKKINAVKEALDEADFLED